MSASGIKNAVVAPTLGDSRIDADGVLHVDGQRRFPLGLYQHVADADLGKTLAAAGFNLMKCDANRDHLDHVKAHGMGAWVALGGSIVVRQEKEGAALQRTVDTLKTHPVVSDRYTMITVFATVQKKSCSPSGTRSARSFPTSGFSASISVAASRSRDLLA